MGVTGRGIEIDETGSVAGRGATRGVGVEAETVRIVMVMTVGDGTVAVLALKDARRMMKAKRRKRRRERRMMELIIQILRLLK